MGVIGSVCDFCGWNPCEFSALEGVNLAVHTGDVGFLAGGKHEACPT